MICAVSAPAHLTKGPVDPRSHPVVTSMVPECITGINNQPLAGSHTMGKQGVAWLFYGGKGSSGRPENLVPNA